MTFKDIIPSFKIIIMLSGLLLVYYGATKGITMIIEAYVPTETVGCVSTSFRASGDFIYMGIDCQGQEEEIKDAEIIAAVLKPGAALKCTRFVSDALKRKKIECVLPDKLTER